MNARQSNPTYRPQLEPVFKISPESIVRGEQACADELSHAEYTAVKLGVVPVTEGYAQRVERWASSEYPRPRSEFEYKAPGRTYDDILEEIESGKPSNASAVVEPLTLGGLANRLGVKVTINFMTALHLAKYSPEYLGPKDIAKRCGCSLAIAKRLAKLMKTVSEGDRDCLDLPFIESWRQLNAHQIAVAVCLSRCNIVLVDGKGRLHAPLAGIARWLGLKDSSQVRRWLSRAAQPAPGSFVRADVQHEVDIVTGDAKRVRISRSKPRRAKWGSCHRRIPACVFELPTHPRLASLLSSGKPLTNFVERRQPKPCVVGSTGRAIFEEQRDSVIRYRLALLECCGDLPAPVRMAATAGLRQLHSIVGYPSTSGSGDDRLPHGGLYEAV